MKRIRTRNNGRNVIGALSALIVMLTAAPALAQYDGARRGHRDRALHPEFTCGIAGCADAHRGPGPCLAKREFDRGHALGYREGKNQGYRDALACRPFCDRLPRPLKRFSKFFALGYVDAYPVAYKTAFFEYRAPPRRPRWERPGRRGAGGFAGPRWGKRFRGWHWGW